MLVLTRKPGETIHIGNDIVITVFEARGEGIRIGIDAPKGVKIHRGEIVDAVRAANEAAVTAGGNAGEQLAALLGALAPAAEPRTAVDAGTDTPPTGK